MAHTNFIIIKDSWKTASFSLQVIGAWVWEHTILCGQADCLLNPFLHPMQNWMQYFPPGFQMFCPPAGRLSP